MVYYQEAFFGKGLLDKSKQSRQAGLVTTGLCEQLLDKCKQSSQTGLVTMGLCEESPGAHAETKPPSASFLDPLSDPLLSATSTTTPISSKAGLRMFTSLLLLIKDENVLSSPHHPPPCLFVFGSLLHVHNHLHSTPTRYEQRCKLPTRNTHSDKNTLDTSKTEVLD